MIPIILIKEYNKEGIVINHYSNFNFNSILYGNFSSVRCFSISILGVEIVDSISIKLSNTYGIEVSNKQTLLENNLTDRGNFGIEFSDDFESKDSLSTFFYDINYDVIIPMKNDNESKFIYLNIKPGSSINYSNIVFNISVSVNKNYGINPEISSSSSKSLSSLSSESFSSVSLSNSSSSNAECKNISVSENEDWIPFGWDTDPEIVCSTHSINTICRFLYNDTYYYNTIGSSIKWTLLKTFSNNCFIQAIQDNGYLDTIADVYLNGTYAYSQILESPYVNLFEEYTCSTSNSSSSMSTSSQSTSNSFSSSSNSLSSSSLSNSSCSSQENFKYCFSISIYQNTGSEWSLLDQQYNVYNYLDLVRMYGSVTDFYECSQINDETSIFIYYKFDQLLSDSLQQCINISENFSLYIPYTFGCITTSSSLSLSSDGSFSSSSSSCSSNISTSCSSSSSSIIYEEIVYLSEIKYSGNEYVNCFQNYTKTNILYNDRPTWRGLSNTNWWIFYGVDSTNKQSSWQVSECGNYPNYSGSLFLYKLDRSNDISGNYYKTNEYSQITAEIIFSSSSYSSSSHILNDAIYVYNDLNDLDGKYCKSLIIRNDSPVYIREDSTYAISRANANSWKLSSYPYYDKNFYQSFYTYGEQIPGSKWLKDDFGSDVVPTIINFYCSQESSSSLSGRSSSSNSSSSYAFTNCSQCNDNLFKIIGIGGGWYPINAYTDISLVCNECSNNVYSFLWPDVLGDKQWKTWYVCGTVMWAAYYKENSYDCYITTNYINYPSGTICYLDKYFSINNRYCSSFYSITPNIDMTLTSCIEYSSSSSDSHNSSSSSNGGYLMWIYVIEKTAHNYENSDFLHVIDDYSYLIGGYQYSHSSPEDCWIFDGFTEYNSCIFYGNFIWEGNVITNPPNLPSGDDYSICNNFNYYCVNNLDESGFVYPPDDIYSGTFKFYKYGYFSEGNYYGNWYRSYINEYSYIIAYRPTRGSWEIHDLYTYSNQDSIYGMNSISASIPEGEWSGVYEKSPGVFVKCQVNVLSSKDDEC